MVNIRKKLSKYNFIEMKNKKNKYIVIHYVGAVSTAKNNVDYYWDNKLKASANYFVDEKSIWQCVEDFNKAWHCGGGLQGDYGHSFYKKCTNSNSIGIEMCVKKNAEGQWYFEEATVQNTLDLVRYLMKKHNIPIDKVIRHYDVTGKICPAPYVDEKVWAEFKKKISGKSEGIEMIYNYIDDSMPEWALQSIKKLVDSGALKFNEKGELNLTYEMLRIFVVLDRMGVFDK